MHMGAYELETVPEYLSQQVANLPEVKKTSAIELISILVFWIGGNFE